MLARLISCSSVFENIRWSSSVTLLQHLYYWISFLKIYLLCYIFQQFSTRKWWVLCSLDFPNTYMPFRLYFKDNFTWNIILKSLAPTFLKLWWRVFYSLLHWFGKGWGHLEFFCFYLPYFLCCRPFNFLIIIKIQ